MDCSHDLSGALASVATAAISVLLAWLSAVSLERFSIRLGHDIDAQVFRPVSIQPRMATVPASDGGQSAAS